MHIDLFDEEQQEQELDIPSLIRGRSVALIGSLASMSRQEFVDLLEANGARYTNVVARGIPVVVVGQKGWPVTRDGTLPEPLREARNLIRNEKWRGKIISEDQFLIALGLEQYRENAQRLYTLTTISQVLNLPTQRVRAWVTAGLIRPARVEYGVWWFDFRQVTSAKKLWELLQSGVPLRRLRASLEQLRRWMPEAKEPLDQLAAFETNQQILARLENGELIEPDGQLHLDFDAPAEPGALKIMPGPKTAAQWNAQGQEQELAGMLAEAAESYRQALLIGGPAPKPCFDLANVLSQQGKKLQALERYWQAIELDSSFAKAWNNLGLTLFSLGRREDAVTAFRKAVSIDPQNSGFLFNLADTLEELGRATEAQEYWRAYLRLDASSEYAEYAQGRLATG